MTNPNKNNQFSKLLLITEKVKFRSELCFMELLHTEKTIFFIHIQIRVKLHCRIQLTTFHRIKPMQYLITSIPLNNIQLMGVLELLKSYKRALFIHASIQESLVSTQFQHVQQVIPSFLWSSTPFQYPGLPFRTPDLSHPFSLSLARLLLPPFPDSLLSLLI